ncbi:MAG: M23 family metallopeptidase [Deltaproteobacteria bacterium]|jgi:hypothetical protein|nr:M23 family metallopeptidase [Deltaproteobacteria bacterium]MBW2530915.1 M23 family metallopeptidase [Deltaproteobacteria bacterium]
MVPFFGSAGVVSAWRSPTASPRWTVRRALLAGAVALLVTSCSGESTDEPWGEAQQALVFMPYLPWPAGVTMGVSQGQFGSYSHTGNLQYAIDFNINGTGDRGIHILSVADGTVTYLYDGCSCDGCSCNGGWGNAVVIGHAAGEYSKYTHLEYDSIPNGIQVGTDVCRGLFIGTLGSTGNSTGPHLHFQFQSGGGLNDPSIDFDRFQETTGVPVEGGSYTSQNQELGSCPTCTDDCSSGERRCGGSGWQECGDYDGDPCLDWGGGAPCPVGTHCEGAGDCVADPSGGGYGAVGGAGLGGGPGLAGTGGSYTGGTSGQGLSGTAGGGLGEGGALPEGVGLEPMGIVGECGCRLVGQGTDRSAAAWLGLLGLGAVRLARPYSRAARRSASTAPRPTA